MTSPRESKRQAAGTPRHVRIFLSSPGDVHEERKIAREVLDSLPRDPLLKGRATIEVVSWDDPTAPVPMFAGLTPQQAVDRGLPMPSECDLTVVILWGRMGTPLSEPRKPNGDAYFSGTEYEFENATAAGKPAMIYRRNASVPVSLDDDDAAIADKRRQKTMVDDFFQRFSGDGGVLLAGHHKYEDVPSFRTQLEAHVKAFVRELLDQPSADVPSTTRVVARRSGSTKPEVPQSYRTWLQERSAGVELLGLRLKQGQHVRLRHVYVPLTTLPAEASEGPFIAKYRQTGTTDFREVASVEPADALMLDRVGEGSAYISGDPGTGKSTFCRWLAWLACEGAVPPADVGAPEEYRERLAPTLSGRLPLFVPLRAFWPQLFARERPGVLIRHDLEDAVANWLETTGAPGIDADLLRAHAEHGSALFVFDGVDEVPPAKRVKLLEALVLAQSQWIGLGNRMVVTSRPYGLTDGEVRQLGLPSLPIRPLPEALQWHLVRRWFGILHDSADEATASTTKMLAQVREQTWLAPLTENPLLLTGMCIVFGDGKGLPEDKYELYDRVSDAVLHNRIPDRQRQQLVRERLAVVAHGMHTGEGLGETRPTPQAEVRDREIDTMLRVYRERSSWTEDQVQDAIEAREELMTQTGVLLQRGDHHAAFLHLSFQEFLAAQRLADVASHRLVDEFVERSRAPEWRNTLSFLFGNLLFTSTTPERAVRLLAELVGRIQPDQMGLALVAADAAEMLLRRGRRLAPAVEERLRSLCVAAMRGNAPARERALVGAALGRIGDPRFRADTWGLPDDDLLGFVKVQAGAFTMGSDKARDSKAYDDELPPHQVRLPDYFIAKWPVTVDQFRAFVADADKGGFVPGDPDCLKGVGNHPVVYVSWGEALAYCRWLTARLRASGATPEPLREVLRGEHAPAWRVTLPSEAEWEKAARGTEGRIYPWGPEPDANCANYGDTGIGGSSAVGCFPDGRSPFKVEELAGNVWEWTRSIDYHRSPYPYEPDYEGSARESLQVSGGRVVRGGAFGFDSRFIRAAYRSGGDPVDRDGNVGFRVVVSPFSSDL